MIIKKEPNRLVVLFTLFVTMFCLGGAYAWSVFAKPLSDFTKWTPSNVSFAYSLLLVIVSIVGIFSGKLLDKYGPRYLMLIAAFLWGGGWFLTGFADSIIMLYFTFGIIAGTGDGFLYNAAVTTAIRWFPDKKGFATGIVLGAAAIAPLFLAPLSYYLLSRYGIMNAFKILGVIFLVLRLSTFWLVDSPKPGWKPAGWEPTTITSTEISIRKDKNWKEMMKDPVFYLLWVSYVFGATPGLMILGHASGIGQELARISGSTAAATVGILAVMNFIGRIFWGIISDKFGIYNTMTLILIITIFDMSIFGQVYDFYSFIIALSIVGMCFGGILCVYPAICAERFGIKNLGLNYGILFTGYGAAAIVGPMLAAYFKQLKGVYSGAFYVSIILSLIALGVLTLIKKMARKEQNEIAF